MYREPAPAGGEPVLDVGVVPLLRHGARDIRDQEVAVWQPALHVEEVAGGGGVGDEAQVEQPVRELGLDEVEVVPSRLTPREAARDYEHPRAHSAAARQREEARPRPGWGGVVRVVAH